MRNIRRKISFILILVFLTSLMIPGMSLATETNNSVDTSGNEITLKFLKSKGIDAIVTSDNEIKLANPDSKSVENANKLLQPSASADFGILTTYRTAWTHMGSSDIYTSKKIQAATSAAFGAALTAWLSTKYQNQEELL